MRNIQTDCIICSPQQYKKHDLYQCMGCKKNYYVHGQYSYQKIRVLIFLIITALALLFTFLYENSEHLSVYMQFRFLKFGVSIGLLAPLLIGVSEIMKKFKNSRGVYCVHLLDANQFEIANKKINKWFVIQFLALILVSIVYTKYLVIPYFQVSENLDQSLDSYMQTLDEDQEVLDN